MKSKKRHQTSSEESDVSDGSDQSSSSSASDSEDSSVSEHQRYKKKRKRADSTVSDSDSENQKRSKKRKHKKKKKKHGKKKRREVSEEASDSADDLSSVSEGEISPKKRRKHKHGKRARSSSRSGIEEVHVERRLHSVVKERRPTSEEGSPPSRTYYQKEYRYSHSGEEFEREREVQRFYRGSSKECRLQYEEQYQYGREHKDRYASYHQDKYEHKNREKYGQSSHYQYANESYNRKQPEFEGYKRHQRYEDPRIQEDYHRKQRDGNNQHSRGEESRGYNRYNQYGDRRPKQREYDESKDYRERRGQPDPERYRQREYPDKREKYREDRYSAERPHEGPARQQRPSRPDKPHPPREMERSRSRSPKIRYREKPDERAEPSAPRPEPKPRERKSRFANADENKDYSWGKTDVKKEDEKTGDKEKPNFGLSGKLTADQNTVNGVVIKYTQPEDAKQPKRRWRFYPFKGDKALPILYIHRQSAFLIGRDKKVADIPLEHPSVSKQHAALQFRATPFQRPDGSQGRRVRPYIIDLDSANGTFVNNKKVEARRYVELLERDVVKFGFSQREYVLLHENSKDDAQDDDHHDPPELGAAVTTTEQIKREKRVKEEMVEDGE